MLLIYRKNDLPLTNYMNVKQFIIIVLLAYEPVLCYSKCIDYAVKVKKAKEANNVNQDDITKYKEKKTHHSYLVAQLKLFEALLEAAPQLILQLVILLSNNAEKSK